MEQGEKWETPGCRHFPTLRFWRSSSFSLDLIDIQGHKGAGSVFCLLVTWHGRQAVRVPEPSAVCSLKLEKESHQ